MKSAILAIDIGTSAVKASLVSDELKVICESSQPYNTQYLPPMRAEQNAQDWWKAACSAVNALFEAHPQYRKDVCAIGVSGHMLGLLPVDKDGNPLAPSLIHADNRAIPQADEIREKIGGERIYSLTGNVLSASASLCKALWLKENAPDIFARTAKFLQSKDYLNFRLTGNMDSTDYSDASHAMLMDISARKPLTDVFSELGLDASMIPQLHASDEMIGRLTEEAARELGLTAGIPVCAGGGDGACSNVGAGVAANNDIYVSLGTTGWIACNQEKPFLDKKQRVFNITSLDGKKSGVFATVQCVGASIEWAKALFEIESLDKMNAMAASVNPGSEGLVFLPYLEGERSPYFDPHAKGVFFGIRPYHKPQHFVRSVFEGVSYALAGLLDILREQSAFNEMRIIGGGAKSALWRQMLADTCRIDIREIDASASAATSIGAAAAAGSCAGVFASIEDAAKRISMTRTTAPIAENTEAYLPQMALFQSLYPLLKPAFHAK